MSGRAAASIALVCATACFDTNLHRTDAGHDDSSSTGTGGAATGVTTTLESTAGTPASSTDPTSGPPDGSGSSGGPASTGSGSADSTGEPPQTCGNGDHDPGEVCFGAVELVDFDPGTVDVAIGIVDADAILDLAVASGGTVGLRVGDGVGGFGNLEAYDNEGTAVAVVVDDLDHDDFGDAMMLGQPLVTLDAWNYGWDMYQSTGNGQGLDAYNDLVIGSFDYTYELDVVYTSASQVVFQSGSKPNYNYLLAAPQVLPGSGGGAAGIAKATFVFDGDASEDVVVVHRDSNDADLVRGGDDAAFVLHATFPVCQEGAIGARHVAIGDIDGDGFQDLVVTCEGDRFAVTVGNDDGSFAAPVAIDLVDGFGVVVADLDGAGEIDVAIASPSSGIVSVFTNDGGTLELAVELDAGEPIAGIDSADLDGDGSRDLAVAVPSGAVALFRSDP